MTKYVEHEVVLYQMPLHEKHIPLSPETVLLKFKKTNSTIDIGARCFLDRANPGVMKRRRFEGSYVNLDSLCNKRSASIRKLIRLISDQAELSGDSPFSINQRTGSFLQFIDWCDANGLEKVLQTVEHTKRAFRGYVEHLRERVNTNNISIITASLSQNSTLKILHMMYEEDFRVGVRLLTSKKNQENHTSPPELADQGKVLSLCEAIFDGVSSFILSNQKYPFKLKIPKYLSYENDSFWLFPATRWFYNPLTHKKKDLGGFNYLEGRVETVDEIKHRYFNSEQGAQRAIKRAQSNLKKANSDNRHFHRLRLAQNAQNAFVEMFIANTAMNWAQLISLQWGGGYEVGVESQGFREIKARAKGRSVSFSIRAGFLKKFNRYLKLREYLLNGARCEWLFFTIGCNCDQFPAQLKVNGLEVFQRLLRRIDPCMPLISVRKWRAGKSDWAVRNTDISTAALLLQNSERTIRRSYIAGSESVMAEEFGNFFEHMSKAIIDTSEKHKRDLTESSLGGCVDFGKPDAVGLIGTIEPDCKQPEGCLFCDKYVIHADERDIRKLLSCRYCIFQSSVLSASKEHFHSVFGATLDRIDGLLDQMKMMSKELESTIERVKKEVEIEEKLDTYWERKMEMLIGLGVMSE